MTERRRKRLLRFYVSADERDVIFEKMATLGTANLSAYLRKMACDGYIINTDWSDIKQTCAEIHSIGVNVNQIARRVNNSGSIFAEDIKELKKALDEIWRLQRLSLLKAR